MKVRPVGFGICGIWVCRPTGCAWDSAFSPHLQHPLAAADGTRVVVINGHLHSADLALLHPSVYIGPSQGSALAMGISPRRRTMF